MVLRPQRLKAVRSKANVSQRHVPFLRDADEPANRCLLELRASYPRVTGNEREGVDQTELPEFLRSHLGTPEVPVPEGTLKASVCTFLYRTATRYNRGLDRDKDGIACEKL
jgi:hypothetical protein